MLIVDDQVGDIAWLIDFVKARGYPVDLATNENAARKLLKAVADGKKSYALAIVDVMMAITDMMSLINLNDKFLQDSRDTGIRLCRYARRELGIPESKLRIVCLTVREDSEVKAAMDELKIRLFNRAPDSEEESIEAFIGKCLPVLPVEGLTPEDEDQGPERNDAGSR
ncbi:MAG: hypothetical protein GY835_22215 [bacterium]|nr:hypothetical protein [bacterium]